MEFAILCVTLDCDNHDVHVKHQRVSCSAEGKAPRRFLPGPARSGGRAYLRYDAGANSHGGSKARGRCRLPSPHESGNREGRSALGAKLWGQPGKGGGGPCNQGTWWNIYFGRVAWLGMEQAPAASRRVYFRSRSLKMPAILPINGSAVLCYVRMGMGNQRAGFKSRLLAACSLAGLRRLLAHCRVNLSKGRLRQEPASDLVHIARRA
jgi:hypothetical protein